MRLLIALAIFVASSLWLDCKAEELTQDDVAFEESVIRAIDSHDSAWLSEHISYPISVYLDGKKVSIKNKHKFIDLYESVVNANIIAAVKKYGNSGGFKNYQGLMLGNGAVWIWVIKDNKPDAQWRYMINAINNCWDGDANVCKSAKGTITSQ